ncbi:MAG: hypothetical protein AMXMBFR83_13580 [Phycisphaerae bacterium]|jgi:aryl-alcohol dehydrogenase-like predicted oxidoreductase
MNRREVLKSAAGLAAWSGFWSARARAQQGAEPPAVTAPAGQETRRGDMLYRVLGKTGVQVSALGLGGYHIGTIKTEKECIQLVRSAIDAGVTFMDNCWDYHQGKSEEWMGAALRDGYREKVFVMSKFDGRTRASAARQIDESLQRLKIDRIDLMQVHEIIRLEDPDRCFAKGGCIEALEEARRAGKVRFVGFTGHKDPIAHNRMLDLADRHGYRFDAVQMPLNVLDASFRSFAQDTLPRLVASGIGVLGMKPLASGAIVKNGIATAQECLGYALTLPTSVVITGMESMERLRQALEVVKNFKPMDKDQMAALLARTAPAARTGEYEQFKTTAHFDGTARFPQWLG